METLTKLLVSTALAAVYFCSALPALAGPFEDGEMAFFGGDYASAYVDLKTAAEQGNGKAAYYIGLLYKYGNGVTKSKAQAAFWFRQGAQAGDPEARQALTTVGENVAVTPNYYDKTSAYNQPHKSSLADVETAYSRGDYHQAYTLIIPLAEAGNKDAQYNLGVFYNGGTGVTKSSIQAAHWYMLSANQGNVDAQFNLANMYREGQGVIQSDPTAFSWYRKAAEQGHAKAQGSIGLMYADGRGVEQSYQNAEKWLRKAGAQGNAGGYFDLANIFHSLGGSQNEDEALVLYGKAAALGHNEANGKIASIERERAMWATRKAEYDREHPQVDGSWKAQQRAITRRINQENANKPPKAPAKVWMCQYIGNGKESCGFK